MWKLPSICGVVLAVSGCTGGIIVQEPVFQQWFTDGETELAMENGEMKTRVFGNPFSPGASDIELSVTRLMKGANRGPEVEFTARPKGAGSEPYHVVMVFNPASNVSAESICANGAGVGSTPSAGGVTLMSGFCFGDTLLSTASGTAKGVKGADDPTFRELVRQVTYSLFPAYDHRDVGSDNIQS